MSIASTLLPEFDHEMGTTRRLLERVPEAAFEWKPHEKSMSLGQLADHLSNLTGWANLIATSTTFDIASVGEDRKPKIPASRNAMLARFDEKVAAARAELVSKTDAELPGVVDAQERHARGLHDAAHQRDPQLRAEPHDPPSRSAERVSEVEGRTAALDLRSNRR